MEVMVFPLGQSILYPSFSKPYHIFESKYVQMVEDSIRLMIPIAIASVLEQEKSPEFRYGENLNFVHPIVGFGYPVVVERGADGSFVIFLEGRGKARLGKTIDKGTPYIVCEAEVVPENHAINDVMLKRFLMSHKVMVQWVNFHVADALSRNQFLSFVKTPEQVIGCYASYLVSDPDLQQLILESSDINEKIGIISRLIESGELVA